MPEENVQVTETNKETVEETTKEEEVFGSATETAVTDEVKVKEDAEEAAKPVVEEEKIEEKPAEEKPVEEKPVTEITGEDTVENKEVPEVEQEVVAVTISEKEEEKEDKKEERAEEKPVVAEEEVKKDENKDEGEKSNEE